MGKLIRRRERTRPAPVNARYGCSVCGPIECEDFISDEGEHGSIEYHAEVPCSGDSYFHLTQEEFENVDTLLIEQGRTGEDHP